METCRRPDGLGSQESDTELELQIRLGEMEKADGSLDLIDKMILYRMKDLSARGVGVLKALDSPEKIFETVKIKPIAGDFSANSDILRSM